MFPGILLFLAVSGSSQLDEFNETACLNTTKSYIKPGFCDVYFMCSEGKIIETNCPEGLVFNPNATQGDYPCHYSDLVNCEGQSRSAKSTNSTVCLHDWALIKDPDGDCGDYINCVGGKPFKMKCPNKLAFDPIEYKCDYADQVLSCNVEEYVGFSCPPTVPDIAGKYSYHPSKDNCKDYYICINGKPRLGICAEGFVFSETELKCVFNNSYICKRGKGQPEEVELETYTYEKEHVHNTRDGGINDGSNDGVPMKNEVDYTEASSSSSPKYSFKTLDLLFLFAFAIFCNKYIQSIKV